jgi:uncharacterized protein YjiS (DUF1127 family)
LRGEAAGGRTAMKKWVSKRRGRRVGVLQVLGSLVSSDGVETTSADWLTPAEGVRRALAYSYALAQGGAGLDEAEEDLRGEAAGGRTAMKKWVSKRRGRRH